ncbi:hypothetical protein OS188_01945 [Xanthomarina sp. F1114]|uniref:hypothetical protein n=1 Tax=Xanthomarina sp. F1114 TaxID=2996019 RepID=UPI00225E4555|nr:hypothetical protein [Xanthomarina sp. F1114]MCX7546709.1 hypothetical protein [Xanthomarina sp. F1114]
MQTHQEYKSFNTEKSIDELQYNMRCYVEDLRSLKEELGFMSFLVNSNIYKSNMMDLFENLERHKKSINQYNNKCELLIIEANLQANQITQKIECDELACDNYFIDAQNNLEKDIHDFIIQSGILKSEIFNYLQSVIKTV